MQSLLKSKQKNYRMAILLSKIITDSGVQGHPILSGLYLLGVVILYCLMLNALATKNPFLVAHIETTTVKFL